MDRQIPRLNRYLEVGKAFLADVPISMVLTDPGLPDNPIVYVNRSFEQLTGYSARASIGQNCRFLQGEGTDDEVVRKLSDAIKAREPVTVVLKNYRPDGEAFNNQLSIAPVLNDKGELYAFVGIMTEVELNRPADESLIESFEEQLSEMQHRVKNHLQMIASLIRIQNRSTFAQDSFKMLGRRVEALALLYDEFYSAPKGGPRRYDVVSAGSYVSRVAATVGALDGRRDMRLSVDVDTVYMRSERAAQVGLLTSEILSNTLKHAFEGREEGIVSISLKQHGGDRVRLVVSDDGIGMAGADWPQKGNLGAQIVRGLVRGLEADLNVATGSGGTTVQVDFLNPIDTTLDDDGKRMLADENGPRAGDEESVLLVRDQLAPDD